MPGWLAKQRITPGKRLIDSEPVSAKFWKILRPGNFVFQIGDEDIHMAIEKALTDRIGDSGGKLHTGRSRNDQVVLDIRLYMREEIGRVVDLLKALKSRFLELAKKEMGVIMPGYTHMQKAQPVLLSHYLLAFHEMLDRDEARLRDCLKRVNVMPLGASALAGTGFRSTELRGRVARVSRQ